jgi:hypothetical protein
MAAVGDMSLEQDFELDLKSHKYVLWMALLEEDSIEV